MARRLTPFALLFLAACTSRHPAGATLAALTTNSSTVAPIHDGNALTLPAARHLVRLAPNGTPRWLLAVQQDGSDGNGLVFLRSDDDAQGFHYYQSIQDDWSERDTADIIVVGNDLALVYSYEGPVLDGSDRHDVYFQWWRHSGDDWLAQPPVRIFDSTSNDSAYYRAELARDSRGRLWVQAFRLESDGSATARIAVSTDGGTTFQIQPDLGTSVGRGGGRLLALGSQLVFVWDSHDATPNAQVRVRDDGVAVGTWGATSTAFDEGIYHGAALSAVADGSGGMHFVYKDKNMNLWYRHFDGASFGDAQLVEDQSEWELQPAITRVGDTLWIFYNRVYDSGDYDEVRVRQLAGGSLGDPTILDGTVSFKGYPAAADVLAGGTMPCFYGVTPDANSSGNLQLYTVALGGSSSPPPPADMAQPRPDLAQPSRTDMAQPRADMAQPRADMAQPSGGVLFSDAFGRNIAPDDGLGNGWSVATGLWYADGNADSDHDGGNVASAPVACANCTVQAGVTTYGSDGGVFLRAPSPTSLDHYDAMLTSSGHIQIRRVRSGVATVLGDTASGVSAFDQPVTVSLQASGAGPVSLHASVNGVNKLSVSDGSASALTAGGYAGITTSWAGVVFDAFVLRAP